jgi:hypothetical protein
MRIIEPRRFNHVTEYRLCFEHTDCRGAGFSFDCDASGKVDESSLTDCARKNYHACLSGSVRLIKGAKLDHEYCVIKGTGKVVDSPVINMGVQSFPSSYTVAAIGECNHCKARVELRCFTNTCECGADYNGSGQELCAREFWTGGTDENLSDILSVDSSDDCFDRDY